MFGGLGPNQPVTRVVQDRLEDGQIFRLVVNDQDVDGRPAVRSALPSFSGGSATGLSATDAHWLLPVMDGP